MSKPIKLVLSGSGVRFPLFIGAIKRLEEEGYHIVAVAGTSGGALVSAGIASGYRSAESLLQLSKELVPAITKELKPSVVSFLSTFGLFKTKKLYALLKEKLAGKMKNTVMPLKVITTNLDAQEHRNIATVWCSEKNPEDAVWQLVAASMAIPLLFPPVKINNKTHVDGGWVKNFAANLWGDTSDVFALASNDDQVSPQKETSWWRFGSRLIRYIGRLIDLSISANAHEDTRGLNNVNIVRLKTSVGGTDFNLSDSKIEMMFLDGYIGMSKYIDENKDKLP